MGLLISIVNAYNHTKCVSLSSQKCMTQPILINLHRNEYSPNFHYYPFAVKLDRCVGSCTALDDISNKVCVPNKTEDLNLSVFSMVTGINESKCQKDYVWNPATCSCENGKYLASVMDGSAITCDEIIESCDEETKTILKNFNEKIITCRTQNFYILRTFLLITMALLMLLSDKILSKKQIFITTSQHQ